MGFIYVLTNPSFEEYVKIGYATDVQKRLNELNSSTAVPFAFRVYATYEVDSNLSDKKLHSILDKLNPDLRSMEEVDGKKRVREFYAMSPEDAYSILEAIAEINGYKDRLKKWKANAEEQKSEKMAEEIREHHKEKQKPFEFSMCNIKPGEIVVFHCRGNKWDGTECTVVDNKTVSYDGKPWSLTGLARAFIAGGYHVAGPKYFKYKDEWLNDIRKRMSEEV